MIQEELFTQLTDRQAQLHKIQERLQSTQFQFEQEYFGVPETKSIQRQISRKLKATSKQILKAFQGIVNFQWAKQFERCRLAQIISHSQLFDRDYYEERYPEIRELAIDPLEHYLDIGRFKGLEITPLFDTIYYLQRYPEVAKSGINPLLHYLTIGAFDGYDPHPLFDTAYYWKCYPEVAKLGISPLVHYVTIGAKAGYNPHPLFDTAYYLENSPDLQGTTINPLAHYLIWGASAARNPHPLFDTTYYLAQNPVLVADKVNSLIDYLQKESFEKYNPHPLFDRIYYWQQEPNKKLSGVNPLIHYLEEGFLLGYDPHPLFNTSFYLEQNREIAESKISPLVDYLKGGAFLGRDPHPLFDSLYYLTRNPQVAKSKINPLFDYLKGGAIKGRFAWSADRITSPTIDYYSREDQSVQLLLENGSNDADFILPDSLKIGVYCSSIGNYFMGEIADLIATALRCIGVEVIRLSEKDNRPDDLTHDIIVAPHEFFYLGRGLSWAEDNNWLAQTVMVNVEQPQTSWFSISFHFLKQASLVFDINLRSATVLRAIGIPAYFLPLGYLPDYLPFSWQEKQPDLLALQSLSPELWHQVDTLESAWDNRPIDLLFIGYLSQRRQDFFAKNAQWLQQYRGFFHIPPLTGPLIQGKGNALTTESVIGLSQRSKILLNIHQSDLPYFEWHRLVFQGLWQKTLVITEPCHPIPGLISGEHYLELELTMMREKINELLNTPAGRETAERIRQAGHEAFKKHFAFETIIKKALKLMVKS